MIYLVYANPWTYVGHASFTSHLYRGLYRAGEDVTILKPAKNTETFDRDFGFGLRYWNTTVEDIKRAKGIKIITGISKPMKDAINDLLGQHRMTMVVHDWTEIASQGWDMGLVQRRMHFVIRKSMLDHFPDAHYIVQPYMRQFENDDVLTSEGRTKAALSISRIDFHKNIHLMLDANRKVRAQRDKIDIFGSENRMYTRFQIMPKYPEWVQGGTRFPKEFGNAAKLCRNYVFMCDMTVLPHDGGGTQYTFMEAMDAGTIPILHEKWTFRKKQDEIKPGKNCFMVADADELAFYIKGAVPKAKKDIIDLTSLDRIRRNNVQLLKRHDAVHSAHQLLHLFGE